MRVRRKELSEKELFEEMPVAKAVATLAIPTVISQVVTMIYNLADTFFVGQIGNPYMVAAVSLVSPWFNLLTALGNLFGLGGGSLISRMLGRNDHKDVKHVSAFSVWGGAVATLVFSLLTFLLRTPLLNFLGASPDTYDYAESYLIWVVVLGGVPTMLSLSMGHLLRSEGHARPASIGMMFGGSHVCLLCCLFCHLCPSDPASLHPGDTDKHAGSQFSSDRLHCSSLYVCQLPDQLYAAGNGKGNPVRSADIQPAGTSEYPSADPDESDCRTVRHDLDTVDRGADHAAGISGNVYAYMA